MNVQSPATSFQSYLQGLTLAVDTGATNSTTYVDLTNVSGGGLLLQASVVFDDMTAPKPVTWGVNIDGAGEVTYLAQRLAMLPFSSSLVIRAKLSGIQAGDFTVIYGEE